jgi:hypothetical protein
MSPNTEIYSLNDFNTISLRGFDYTIPEDVLNQISEIAIEVGSPNYVKTPIFKKVTHMKSSSADTNNSSGNNYRNKKRRHNKNMEIKNEEEWSSEFKNFQTTKLNEKTGIHLDIDVIRSHLNKMSEKNYDITKNKIVEIFDVLVHNNTKDDLIHVSSIIFEIASTNRFFSLMYANLYTYLIHKYDIMREIFNTNFDTFLELFNNFEYVDPNVDYDNFCRINKNNEKRKSLSSFFVNLMLNHIITHEQMLIIIHKLMNDMFQLISIENKKNEVDELVENIAILYNPPLFKNIQNSHHTNCKTIIEKIAHSKVKDYVSLTNKTIFKCMDILNE